MLTVKTYILNSIVNLSLKEKLGDYAQLFKLRLTLLVVFSTFAGYVLASSTFLISTELMVLVLGGFFIVGAANGLNQVLEKNSDKLMHRTENRPIARNRMSVSEAVVICTLSGLIGVFLLGYFLNHLSAFIALISLVLYAFVYTPLKKISPVAVFVGAIPGALPPLIGYVAFTGAINQFALILFMIQFIWQFPHFWAIAWVLNDDYKRAGFKLLPLGDKKDKKGAVHIMMFTVLLLPLSVLPLKLGLAGVIATAFIFILSLLFLLQAVNLYRKLTDKAARQLMFGSFIYLPLVLICLILTQLI